MAVMVYDIKKLQVKFKWLKDLLAPKPKYGKVIECDFKKRVKERAGIMK